MNQDYFSLFEIPDLIIKKGYSRKDYDDIIIKLLNKVKVRYLAEKKTEMPQKDLKDMVITDDDLIPLAMLDWVIKAIEHKHEEKIESF